MPLNPRALFRFALLAGLSTGFTACSSAPTYTTAPQSAEAFDDSAFLTDSERAHPRAEGPISRAGTPRYPDQALNFGEPATVVLVLTIGPKGKVASTRIAAEEPQGWGVAAATEEWVRQWTFAESSYPERVYVLTQHFLLQ